MDRTKMGRNDKQLGEMKSVGKKKQRQENKYSRWIRLLIPHYATNRQVLGFLHLSTWIKFPKKNSSLLTTVRTRRNY